MKTKFQRTKIVATLGPATDTPKAILELIRAGANIFRINFSHGDLDYHRKLVEIIYSINEKYKFNIGILGDLGGPKIRVGNLKKEGVALHEGANISFTTDEKRTQSDEVFFIDYKYLAAEVNEGEQILIDDGKLELVISETNKKDTVKCKVIHGGTLLSRKGVNLPNSTLTIPSLTDRDLECLNFALEKDLEWIALSFVRKEVDIIELRQIINRSKKSARIIAKIEKPEALADIENIIQATDGVMVARGDLGIEIPLEEVPMEQKKIIKLCQKENKPVIIATQMLENMLDNPRPTRAEVNDVANSVLDGTDAVMLSGETSVGKYATLTVETMKKIIVNIESKHYPYYMKKGKKKNEVDIKTSAICESAVFLAQNTNAIGIISLTASGASAVEISSYRASAYTFVFTSNKKLLGALNLVWGVKGFYFDQFVSTDHTIEEVNKILLNERLVTSGDVVINTASMPIEQRSKTNMIKITTIE